MGDEAVPELQGGVGVADIEAGNKVILVCLDGVFCGVGAMQGWRNELELYAGMAYCFRPPGHSLSSIWYWGVRPRLER